MRRAILVYGLVCMAGSISQAQIRLTDNTAVVFATAEEGKKILTTRDEFIRALSPFDRAARMKRDREVSEQMFLEFVGQNVLAWTEAEKAGLTAALENLETRLSPLPLPWPKVVYAVKTTGAEEGGAAYTRANALVLPRSMLAPNRPTDARLICHELFHILSRSNPDLRERLYGAIGFVKCSEVEFPEALRRRRLTNPDAPANNHCIRVQVGRNTQYIIHPEEILADNFAALVMQDRDVPSPAILRKLQEVLAEKPAPALGGKAHQ